MIVPLLCQSQFLESVIIVIIIDPQVIALCTQLKLIIIACVFHAWSSWLYKPLAEGIQQSVHYMDWVGEHIPSVPDSFTLYQNDTAYD